MTQEHGAPAPASEETETMRFKDKVALVTGGGAGIGRQAAIAFAAEGAAVAINDLGRGNCAVVVEQIAKGGGRAVCVPGDVSCEADAERIVGDTVRELGRLDILVNCAGIVVPGRVDDTSESDWDRTMSINLKGVFLMSKHAVPAMKQSGGGAIVNVASAVVLRGVAERAAYTASKGGVWALTKAMAADYMRESIRVNSICPGTTTTPSFEQRVQAFDDPDEALRDFVARQPLGRLGTVEEMAAAILFLASDDAGFIQGTSLAVDGGMSL